MDPNEFDQTKFVTELVKDFSISIFDRATKLTASQIKRLKTKFGVGFADYLSETVSSASLVKTILYRDFSENISNIYVEQYFLSSLSMMTDAQLRSKIVEGSRIIISGAAGSGKSFFVKNLIYTAASEQKSVPIFIEIRNVENESNSILHHIVDVTFSTSLVGFDKDDLDYALKSGLFFIVLDGLDEATESRRRMFLSEIEFMTQRYPNLGIVVTSRPDESLESLPNFPVYRVQPLNIDQSRELVSLLSFDETVKSEFLHQFESIFGSHFEFASNPLLLTMLLITFDQVGNIPNKMHIFYSQAFEALVFKHDLMKSRYRRPQKSGLEINELRRVYAHFCATTYLSSQLAFGDADLLDALQHSINIVKVKTHAPDLADDLITCYSMLKREGLSVTFVHRSFQEYFCALHIANKIGDSTKPAITKLSLAPQSEQAFSLLANMSPDLVLDAWAASLIEELLDVMDKTVNGEDLSLGVRVLFNYFVVSHSPKVGVSSKISFGESPRLRQLKRLEVLLQQLGGIPLCSALGDRSHHTLSDECVSKIGRTIGPLLELNDLNIEPKSADNEWLKMTNLPARMAEVFEWLQVANNYVLDTLTTDDGLRLTDSDNNQSFRVTDRSFESVERGDLENSMRPAVAKRTNRRVFD